MNDLRSPGQKMTLLRILHREFFNNKLCRFGRVCTHVLLPTVASRAKSISEHVFPKYSASVAFINNQSKTRSGPLLHHGLWFDTTNELVPAHRFEIQFCVHVLKLQVPDLWCEKRAWTDTIVRVLRRKHSTNLMVIIVKA